jgi:hypothetical protein
MSTPPAPPDVVAMEQALLAAVDRQRDEPGLVAVWLEHDSPHAELVRAVEAGIFPEVPELMLPFEDQCFFLALVDTRPDVRRLMHAFRLSSRRGSAPHGPETTGIVLVDDLIASGQGLTAAEVVAHFEGAGTDLDKCISVETNFRVGGKVKVRPEDGLPISQLGYVALFRSLERFGVTGSEGAVFAHLNKVAVVSLKMVGVEYFPFAGRADLRTPTVGHDGFDPHYKPVTMPTTPKNVRVFGELLAFAAPELEL